MTKIIDTLSKGTYTLEEFMFSIIPVVYKNYLISYNKVNKILSGDPRIRIAEYVTTF